MGNVTSFVKEVLARLSGNEGQVVAEKNYRKAKSAINSQLAALRAKEVDEESAVENAEEQLHNAKYPTDLIDDNKYYVQNIVAAETKLKSAQNSLEETRTSIEYFDALLKEFDTTAE